jgi:hypothetical protein
MSQFWMDDEEPKKTWTLKDVYDDLGTKTDVAAVLDVTIWRMNMWLTRRERIHCPMPIRRLGAVDVYSISEWKVWFARWTGDPKRAKWVEKTMPNGSGLSFFTLDGPDRGRRGYHEKRYQPKTPLRTDAEIQAAAAEAAGDVDPC